jgi:hypothetical protein
MRSLGLVVSRILGSAALIVLLAGPAAAQSAAQPVPRYGEPDKEKSATEIAAEKEAERAYQRSLGNIPAQKSTDPWGTMRSEDAPKAAKAAPAKPKAKTDAKTDATKSADSKTGVGVK